MFESMIRLVLIYRSWLAADYTEDVQYEIRVLFAALASLRVHEVTVTIIAGSVLITVELAAEDASAAANIAAAVGPVTASAAAATSFLAAVSGVNITVADVSSIVITPSPSPPPPPVTTSDSSTGLVLAGALGGSVATILILAVVIVLKKMQTRRVTAVRPGIAGISLPAQGRPPVAQPSLNLGAVRGASDKAWSGKAGLYTEC